MERVGWLIVLAVMILSPVSVQAVDEVPGEVLERYWECRERHDLDTIRDLLWVHNDVERIDASIYGLPTDDFDDRSLLTIQERLNFRAEKAAIDEEMATSGPSQYPHFLRKALDAHYERTGERPGCSQILVDADLDPDAVDAIGNDWPSDLNLTGGDSISRGEVHVSVNPVAGNHVIATSVPGGANETSSFLATTSDWGETWNLGQLGNNGGYVWECDPVTYYQTATGNAYHAKLACTTGTCSTSHTVVRRSEDNGVTWTDCEARPGIGSSEDREWLVVDNTPTSPCYGTIYATWHNLNSEKISRSIDQCETWSSVSTITAAGNALGPDLGVAADGTALVVWDNYGTDTLRFASSTNCGETWTPWGGQFLFPNNAGWHSGSIPAQCQRDAKSQPFVDADRSPSSPFFGRIYVVIFTYNQACYSQANWTCVNWDNNWTNPCNFDIFFMYSDDNGANWSTPVNLTEGDGNNVDHFLGMARVDPADGSIYIAYHRTRLNPVALEDRQKSHYFVMRSIDGGQTWEEPLQISTLEGDQRVPGGVGFERGDYQGVDVANGVVWPIWIDRRETTAEEEIIIRKVCSEPAHWSERSPTFAPPEVEIFGNSTLNIRWEPPDIYWGDGDQNPDDRMYQLWVDGALAIDDIPWTTTSVSYDPGDTASHSYVLRAVNQCGLSKDYAEVEYAACVDNPSSVDVTPDGPMILCSGSDQLLTATPIGGSGDVYQWTRDGAPVGGDSATYLAADSGDHIYNCEVTNASCGDGVVDLESTRISWQSAPLFDGLQSVTAPAAGACALLLEWDPASPVCAGPVVYNVYRSETPGFTPSSGNRVATAVTGTSYVDTAGLTSGTAYHYVVRALDTSVAAEESNLVELFGEPSFDVFPLLDDDFESGNQGWVFELGTPAASTGDFVIGDPVGTVSNYGAPSQPEDDHTPGGVNCLYTAENPGADAGVDDVDAGEVIATSPVFDGEGMQRVRVSLWRWFFNEDNDDAGDYYALDVSNDGGGSWTALEEIPGSVTNANVWTQVAFNLEEFVDLTANLQIRVRAADGTGGGDLVELAIDDVEILGYMGCLPVDEYVFLDGFDTGNTSGWSGTTP